MQRGQQAEAHVRSCSDLLDPGEEPFEVYPSARLSSCLAVALYILFCPHERFAQWESLEGALSRHVKERAEPENSY